MPRCSSFRPSKAFGPATPSLDPCVLGAWRLLPPAAVACQLHIAAPILGVASRSHHWLAALCDHTNLAVLDRAHTATPRRVSERGRRSRAMFRRALIPFVTTFELSGAAQPRPLQ